jgi:plastocyanin
MTRYPFYLAGSICLLAFLFACNDQPQQTVTPTRNNTSDTVREDTVTSTAGLVQNEHTHTIVISQMKFNPDELTIPRGDTVVWINNDITNHCVTENNKAWTSSALAPTQSFKKAITKNTDYYCAIHMVMKGKISVE